MDSPRPHSGDAGAGVEHALERFSRRVLLGVLERDFPQVLSEVLSDLNRAFGAQMAEVFLAEPEGDHLVMLACAAEDSRPFLERTRFASGEGLPGLVHRDGEMLRVEDLRREPRYLRRSVVQAGYRAYLCAPMKVGGSVLGSLQLAWKGRPPDWRTVESALAEAARILAAALVSREGVLEHMGREVARAARPGVKALASFLSFLQRRAGARAGVLFVFDEKGRVTKVARRGRLEWPCADVSPGAIFRCCVLEQGHGVLRGAGVPAGAPCRSSEAIEGQSRLCLPLMLHGRLFGAALLELPRPEEDIPTRPLPDMLWSARAISYYLSEALRRDRSPASRARDPLPPPAPSRPLSLFCLGPFRILRRGEAVPLSRFARRKSVEILRILAVHAGTPLSAVQIAEWLWPGEEEARSLNRFHVALHELRKGLGDTGRRARLILSEHGRYFLDAANVYVDVEEFRRLDREGRRLLRQGQIMPGIAALEAAVRAYRDDLFVDDLYADWSLPHRVRLREDLLSIFQVLVRSYRQIGDKNAAVEALRSAVRWEPFREDLWQELIRALLDLGRVDEARRHYRECLRVLSEEADIEPLPQTRSLAAHMGL